MVTDTSASAKDSASLARELNDLGDSIGVVIHCQHEDIFNTVSYTHLDVYKRQAHGFAMGYNYNGKLKSAEILLHEDGSFQLIRRAETPKDYFATFDCFPVYEKLLEDADKLK